MLRHREAFLCLRGATIAVQSRWRGAAVRTRYRQLLKAAITIQVNSFIGLFLCKKNVIVILVEPLMKLLVNNKTS